MKKASSKIDWSKYTSFQRRVFEIVMKIPQGKTLTYGEVAKRLGNRKLARAVGMALSKNQDIPIIPCHRVVGYNTLGGYSGKRGLLGKKFLLKKEGVKFT